MRNRKLFHNSKPAGSPPSTTRDPARQLRHETQWWETEWSDAAGKLSENSNQDLERWHWKKVLAAMAES